MKVLGMDEGLSAAKVTLQGSRTGRHRDPILPTIGYSPSKRSHQGLPNAIGIFSQCPRRRTPSLTMELSVAKWCCHRTVMA